VTCLQKVLSGKGWPDTNFGSVVTGFLLATSSYEPFIT